MDNYSCQFLIFFTDVVFHFFSIVKKLDANTSGQKKTGMASLSVYVVKVTSTLLSTISTQIASAKDYRIVLHIYVNFESWNNNNNNNENLLQLYNLVCIAS